MFEELKNEIQTKGEVTERIKVIANSSETYCKPFGEYLKCKVKAPATDGEANNELRGYLKRIFPGTDVKIVGGANSELKTVKFIRK